MEKQDFIDMVRTFETLESERKEILDEINEKLKSWGESHNVEPKIIRKAIRSFLKYESDKTAYLEEDRSIDQILMKVIEDEGWG